ncbi:DUF3592 domain-containing protein [Blastococcus litoris]|uniref:DUF3592 domain-containing protein n=1 Tax=Blastococcus litoris TaxID=2171622 RepID=UPI0013DF4B08|nr:DUF3592 domain-containing protein [Blastococcus litoris]
MPAGSAPRPWWAIGFLAAGALWLLFVGSLFLTGYWATVTVTGGAGDGFCDVVWDDPGGHRLSGESDCYDEPPGSRFEVRVSGWPDADEPTLVETYVGMGLLLGLPPVALGGGRLLQLARRRLPPAPELETPTAPPGSGGALADPRTVSALNRVRRRAWTLVAIGTVGVCGVVVPAAVEIEADEALRAVGVTTVGTVVQVEPDSTWSTGAASVRFTANGTTQSRDVLLGGYADDYVSGDAVDVVYDPADPDRFIIDDALYGFAWTGWVLAPAIVLALVAPFGIARAVRVREMRRLLAHRSWARVQARALNLENCWEVVTVDGAVWRSGRYLLWVPDWASPEDTWQGENGPAWWVSDGATALFAAHPGGRLVLTRRRRGRAGRAHRPRS